MAAYASARCMTRVTRWLSAKNRVQLQNPTHAIKYRVWATFTFFISHSYGVLSQTHLLTLVSLTWYGLSSLLKRVTFDSLKSSAIEKCGRRL